MFKAIKEFFLGKPKVKDSQCPYKIETVDTTLQHTDLVKVEEQEVFIDKTVVDTITITSNTDLIPSTVSTPDTWPFTAPPATKKRATTKKPKNVVVEKPPVPAIKAGNSKIRKKK